MRNAISLLIVCHGLGLAPSVAQALGFGPFDSSTALGAPLNFSAQLSVEPQDALTQDCISAEVTAGASRIAPEQVRISLAGPADATRKTLRITTSVAIDEPVVEVNVSIGCDALRSRISRSFVVFADPPTLRSAALEIVAPQLPADSTAAAAHATTAARPQAGFSAAAPRQRDAAMQRRGPSSRADGAREPVRAASTRTVAPRVVAAANAPTVGAPRLRLEATRPPVERPAPAPPAGSAALPTVVAVATPDELRRLRAQNEALQRSVGTLESRLREVEGARGRDPWFIAAAFLVLALALLGVAVLWRRVRDSGKPSWFHPTLLAPAGGLTERVANEQSAPAPAFEVSEMRDGVVEDGDEDHGPMTTRSFAMTLPGEPIADAGEPRGALSAEEMFDLEQQADFFLALGQEEAAIDLLLGHARRHGAANPMPYLRLLDIYRRRGDREGFEATRQRFNPRFNTTVGDWDADVDEGRPLDESADLLASLQSVWQSPAVAVQMLAGLVWRSDGPPRELDLATYRDLLVLYAIARDLLDRAENPQRVDLALPLLEGERGDSHVALLMSSTIPMRVQEEHGRGLERGIVPDLDLSAPAAPPGFTPGTDFIRIDTPPPDAEKS